MKCQGVSANERPLVTCQRGLNRIVPRFGQPSEAVSFAAFGACATACSDGQWLEVRIAAKRAAIGCKEPSAVCDVFQVEDFTWRVHVAKWHAD
jgi:hypothetical protein